MMIFPIKYSFYYAIAIFEQQPAGGKRMAWPGHGGI
jgi:hypothetical protein